MTIKPWGDEPAEIHFTEDRFINEKDGKCIGIRERQTGGFTKLERACIDLKVPDPSLDPKLRELILESRRLDYAGQAMNVDGVCIVDAFEIAKDMISELEKK